MGQKGNRRHLKRYALPAFINVPIKKDKFLMKPSAGPHPKDFCFPLGHVLRDILKISANNRETLYILNNHKVNVDGRTITSYKFPIGIMDVIEIADINKAYRVLPSAKHGLMLSEITKDEAKFKLCRIENITTVRKGNVQLNLHDGRNVLVKVDDAKKKLNLKYQTKGTLKISLPDQEILDFFPMAENNQAIIMHGKNQGIAGKIVNITKRFGNMASTAVLEKTPGSNLTTAYEFAFVIGTKKPAIDLPME